MRKEDILSRTLITGADGMVGSYIDFGIKTDRKELDVTNLASVQKAFRRYKPRVVIHLAAETDLEKCEKNPARAFEINTQGTHNTALAAKEVGAKMIYISTAGVFDGKKKGAYKENDVPNPLNVYGRSKFYGELAVQGTLSNFAIVRVCWMMGGGPSKDKKFVSKFISQLEHKKVFAVSDQYGSPTYAKDLVQGFRKIIQENGRGIFHLSNSGRASRYDVAKEIVHTLQSKVHLSPVLSDFFKSSFARAQNEVMHSRVSWMRPWRMALRDYLKNEWSDFIRNPSPRAK